jgi:hypothetical protein
MCIPYIPLKPEVYITPWWTPDDKNYDTNNNVAFVFVGTTGNRVLSATTASCVIAGPEVGHMRADVLNMESNLSAFDTLNWSPHTFDPTTPGNLGAGGWGLPLCLGSVNEWNTPKDGAPYGPIAHSGNQNNLQQNTPRECIPINCINANNIFHEENPDLGLYAVGRVRPNKFGLVQNFYNGSTRTTCSDSNIAFEPNETQYNKDRKCASATTIPATTIPAITTIRTATTATTTTATTTTTTMTTTTTTIITTSTVGFNDVRSSFGARDKDRNGLLDRAESGLSNTLFVFYDTNADDYLSRAELGISDEPQLFGVALGMLGLVGCVALVSVVV